VGIEKRGEGKRGEERGREGKRGEEKKERHKKESKDGGAKFQARNMLFLRSLLCTAEAPPPQLDILSILISCSTRRTRGRVVVGKKDVV
jgi:hypothetical protein